MNKMLKAVSILAIVVLVSGCLGSSGSVKEASKFASFDTSDFKFSAINENVRKFLLVSGSSKASLASEIDWFASSGYVEMIKTKKTAGVAVLSAVLSYEYDKIGVTTSHEGVIIYGQELVRSQDRDGETMEVKPVRISDYKLGSLGVETTINNAIDGDSSTYSSFGNNGYIEIDFGVPIDKAKSILITEKTGTSVDHRLSASGGSFSTTAIGEYYTVTTSGTKVKIAADYGGSSPSGNIVEIVLIYPKEKEIVQENVKEIDPYKTCYAIIDNKYILYGDLEDVKKSISIYKTGAGSLESKMAEYLSSVPAKDMYSVKKNNNVPLILSIKVKSEYVLSLSIGVEKAGDYLPISSSIESGLLRKAVEYKKSENSKFVVFNVPEISMSTLSGIA